MKKCTLCVDRIENTNLPEEDRLPACVRTCPAGARHFGDLADPDSAVSQLVAERGGIDLMPEQGTLLRALARKPGEAIARAALAEQTSSALERSVDVQVTRLRKKIEDDPRTPIYLQTMRGVGYALLTD